jgi:hypothetical protein
VKRGADVTLGNVAIRLPASESKIVEQQSQINVQSDQINRLITFSMSWYIYEMMFQLHQAKKFGGQYIFRENGSMSRTFRFLIDHCYLQEVYDWPKDGDEITSRITFTQAGEALILMRGRPGDAALRPTA